MKTKKQKAAMLKRAKAGVKGLIATWVDPDPMSSGGTRFSDMGVSHRNPVWRLASETVLRNHGDWIIGGSPFRWLINLDVVFDYPNGIRQIETREVEAFARMEDLNPYCFDAIEDAIRHGDKSFYRHVKFTVECIGI